MCVLGLGLSDISSDMEWFCYGRFIVPSMHNMAWLNKSLLALFFAHVVPKIHPSRAYMFHYLRRMLEGYMYMFCLI